MELLNDFKTTVRKALDEIDPNWESYNGLIVAGTHSPEDTELTIKKIQIAREANIPFLGICMGFQLMAIEWVRAMVQGAQTANSTEIDPKTPYPVVVKMKEKHTGVRPIAWFDSTTSYESFWHNYALNPHYLKFLPPELWNVSIAEHAVAILQLRTHPFFVGTQFHPEYQSSKDKPHRVLASFIKNCKKI